MCIYLYAYLHKCMSISLFYIILIIFKFFVMIVDILFILLVFNGILITIFIFDKHIYTYSYKNNSIIIHILYKAEIFSVNITFNDVSNDVSFVFVAQNFTISTCLKYVDIYCFCQFSQRL